MDVHVQFLKPWVTVTVAEPIAFLSILIFMGIKVFPDKRIRWSDGPMGWFPARLKCKVT